MSHKFNPHTDELDYYESVEEQHNQTLNLLFPIGSIYLNITGINPGVSRALGGLGYGTWVQVAQGDTLIGAT